MLGTPPVVDGDGVGAGGSLFSFPVSKALNPFAPEYLKPPKFALDGNVTVVSVE